VSHEPPDANEFRVAYREFLEELVRLAPSTLTGPPPWAGELFGDPLRFPPELDRAELATAKRDFAVLMSRLTPADRDVYREIAKSELRELFELRVADTQLVQPRAARRTPAPAHADHAPFAPPPRPASKGLGGKLRSVFSALRRGKPSTPQPAPHHADDDDGSWHYEIAPTPVVRPPSAPAAAAPPPAAAAPAPPRTDITLEAPVPSVAAEPSDERISRDITGGTAQLDAHTGAHRGTHAKPPAHDDDGGLLSIDPPSAGAEPDEADARPAEPESRYLNAKLADREPDAPLELVTSYVLEVSVDLKKIAGAAAAQIPDASLMFEPDEEIVTLTVQVTGDDFDIAQDHQELKLPRRGPSKGKARFDVTPKHEGRCSLTVSVHKDGNFVMQLAVTYSVGLKDAAPESVAVLGRPISAAAKLTRRELGMTITPSARGYDCIVRGPTHTSVVLPVSEAEIADAIRVARDAMMSVVSQRDAAAALVFQTGIAIDDASRDRALRTLAVAGGDLFQRIFYGPAAGADVQNVGELLKKQATKPGYSLDFQVVATRFPVPWGLLYFGDTSDGATIDPELFLGMRHVVEAIPLQTGMLVDDTVINSENPSLAVSVNVNTDIDGGKLNLDGVARQLAYWDKCATTNGAHLTVAPRRTKAELLGALRDGARDQLMYLYCHAITNAPADPGGIRNAAFQLTGGERLTLGDMYRESPTTQPLPGNPLVFINACESGELRPEFYDGFIPYFMAKGARGVVGTECKTPAVFASEWALRFFPRFLDGEPLGDIFLDLRREFHTQHGNPLGLLYNVYCDADTRIQPGLTI
jgi:hypothetical protein